MVIKARWVATLLVLAIALSAAQGAAAQAATGTIKGTLVNKSAQGDKVNVPTVSLHVTDDASTESPRTATVDADGKFSFPNLPVGKKYMLAAQFMGVTYTSDEIDLAQDKSTQDVEFAVYNTTDKADAISVSRSHVIINIDPDSKSLVVLEALIVANSGDRSYVGGDGASGNGQKQTLSITLPKGAANVEFGQGLSDEYTAVVNGAVVDTTPVPPGQRQIVMTYSVPYDGSTASFSHSVGLKTERAIVLVRDFGAQVTGVSLPNKTTNEFNGDRYLQFSADNLQPGQTIGVQVASIPANIPKAASSIVSSSAAPSAAGPDRLALAAIGVGALGLVLGVAYPVARRRRKATQKTSSAGSSDVDWNSLLSAMASLDDEFEAGRLDEAEYRQRRAETKAQLLNLSRQPGRT